jgi:hypothetical protein
MPDLVVKFLELADSQADLKKIMIEFDGTTKRVEGLADIWGNDDVAGAMHGFATDWKDHRAKLLEKMDDAYKHSEKCLQSWEKTDSGLAAALETHENPGPGHSRPGMN